MKIIESNGYYYLKHSFRVDGRVLSKEKYLGKTIPANIDQIRSSFRREINQSIYEKLESISSNFQKEWGRTPLSAREREKQEIAIAFTYNTNAIEGSKITLEETREIIVDRNAPNKALSDVKEIEAHANVFLDMLDKRDKLSEKLLLRWHELLFAQTKFDIAGKYRDYHVRVGDYRCPDWQDVKELMKEMFKFINQKLNPVELAARVHYKFEKIHPFGDGNGRIGRLIINHILWQNRYPMLIIEYGKRKSYYKALERDEDRFVNYFFRRYLAVHSTRKKS